MLVPCTRCRRHVQIDDLRCPFCGCETPRSRPAVALVGRISRVAVFTSAIVAANACDQGRLPDKVDKTSPIKTGAVKGVATWNGANAFGTHSGQLSAADVTLDSTDGKVHRKTRTNAQGEFEFVDVPVGSYLVALAPDTATSPSSPVPVEVHADSVENANLASYMALPYGAPPGRRRLV